MCEHCPPLDWDDRPTLLEVEQMERPRPRESRARPAAERTFGPGEVREAAVELAGKVSAMLKARGYHTEPTGIKGRRRVLNKAGEVLHTGTALNVWYWLLGALPEDDGPF